MMGWTVFASTATAGLIAHYPLDGDADDAVGSYNLTVTGTITYDGADLQVGTSSGVFNGSSFGSVGMPDLTSQTYAFWVYPTANGFPLSRDGSSRFEVRLLSGEILIYLNSTATIDTRGTATLDVPLNQWTHVAITLDETAGEVSLYINKILWETVATSRSISGEPLFVGARAYSGGSSPFLGKIDDVRVYDTVLSSSEVAQLPPIATSNAAPDISLAETGVFVEPGAETSLPDATVLDDDFPGNPVSAITWSVTDQPTGSTVTFDATTNNTVTLSDAGNYTLTASVNDGELTNDVSLLLVGRSPGGALQNHWEFETNLTDSVSGIEGQAVTNAYVSSFTNILGQAVEFDGSLERVIDCGPFGGATTGSLTYAVWLKPFVIANQEVVTKYSSKDGSAGFRISLRSDSSVRFYVGSSSPIYAEVPNNSYAVDEWVHLACTIDLANDLVTAYVNGESVASRDLAGKTPGILDSDASLFLGSYYNLQYSYAGLMDDFRFYDQALSPAEIGLIYNSSPDLQIAVGAPVKMEVGDSNLVSVVISNSGGLASNVTSTLIHNGDASSFSIVASNAAASLGYGTSLTNTYWVTANANGKYIFTAQAFVGEARSAEEIFNLAVGSQAIPSVSPSSIMLRAIEGGSATETLMVKNEGDKPFAFSITDDSTWGTFYSEQADDINFSTSARTPLVLNDGGLGSAAISDAISLGFNFPFYGTTYSHFYVTSAGVIGMGNSGDTPDLGMTFGALPSGSGLPLIAPFWSKNLISPDGTIYYQLERSRVIISYTDSNLLGGGTGLKFQAILYSDGRIEFRYDEINGSLNVVAAGIQSDDENYRNMEMTPVSDTSVMFTSQDNSPWVTYSPNSGEVDPLSFQTVTFTLNAGQPLGSQNSFMANVAFSSGGSENVSVDAMVMPALPEYSADSNLDFFGPAGEITTAPFVITNTGTAPLTFRISDSGSAEIRFDEVNPEYSWIDISSTGTDVELNDPSSNPYITAEDEGYSDPLPIGFSFPFGGSYYRDVVVGVNGTLRFDTTGRVARIGNIANPNIQADQLIVPYGGDLVLDQNATLKTRSAADRLVVTWENVKQYGLNGGSDLTFQVILTPDGNITCQYKFLQGGPWPTTVVGGWRDLIDGAGQYGDGNIILPGDGSPVTNAISGMVRTQYVESVSERAFALQDSENRIIRYAPTGGSVPAGGTAEIAITGDASNQSLGDNAATANTVLTISHNASGSPDTLDVTFTATNSQETVFVPLAAADDSDGDGMADDAERIAGSDPQNAGSVFTPKVTRSPEGAVLSWEEPLDGLQRIYKVYWTVNLLDPWMYLDTVTTGTSYVDGRNINETAVYYKVTAE